MLVQIANSLVYDEDKIAMLWRTMVFVRAVKDIPLQWRLNDVFLDAVSAFLNIDSCERLLTERFLDTAVDYTTGMPHLLAQENRYFVELRC